MGRGKRPAFDCDRAEFEELCRQRNTEEDIADYFGISICTLQRWCKRTYKKSFEEVYRTFKTRGRVSLRRWMWKSAEEGSVTMQIYLSKNELGMSDKNPDTSYDAALNKLDHILAGIDKQASEVVTVDLPRENVDVTEAQP